MFFNDEEYLLLPLRDTVVFPNCTTILTIGRKSSLINVEKAYLQNEHILCVAQKDKETDEIKGKNDLFDVGVVCDIQQKISLPNGELRIFIRGIKKVKIENVGKKDGSFVCSGTVINEIDERDINKEELDRTKTILFNKAETFIKNHLQGPLDLFSFFRKIESDIDIIYILTNLLNVDISVKQSILELNSNLDRFIKLSQFLEIEKSLIDTEKEINSKIDKKLQEHQKNFFLREKMKIIRKELKDSGEDDDKDETGDIGKIRAKAKTLALSKDAKEKVKDELEKLQDIPSYSPEYSVIKSFLDLILSLPWGKKSRLLNDLKKAEEVLNSQHYGLDDIKERIIEFIAVLKNTKQISGPIICLVGPPGVGKTSLAKSIAEATNREYIKVSLGGLRDEAEIRGHRKTYVGAMPGKIIQAIKKAKVDNPLILLDEIDKMGSDSRGDPVSALLEVLDPEQNKKFNDHFMEIEYDLSNVLFLATANSLQGIPYALRDRMEIIKLSGYTEDEKLEIAKKYLIPKQMKQHNITDKQMSITDEAIYSIIRKYTFEAGVRELERKIETIVRKITRKIVENPKTKKISVEPKNLKEFLSVEIFDYTEAQKEDTVGLATGMAYTEMGGDLLYIEALKFDGSGKINTTGKLGDVMKESVQAGFSYVRSKAGEIGITAKEFNKFDFHLHVPEGATPKDGPSAGVAIATALMSSITGLKIRSDTSMTGEITLLGKVLPIGGLKEKLLSALRGRIKNVLIPEKNVKDLEKLPDKVKKELNIIPISTVEEAFKFLLVGYDKMKKKKKK